MRDNYFTPKEVARRLHRNEQTIRRYLREGRLQGIRVGTRWLITDADLQLFLWESRVAVKEEERP